MFLKEFNQGADKRIKKLNSLLESEFGISVKAGFPSKRKLEKLAEHAEKTLVTLRSSNKKFQLEPEYAKFLGIKDVVSTMINEGLYADSPKHKEMKSMVADSVRELMDSGYTMDEACNECMNRFRMDSRFAYDDEHVLPIVIKAAKDYMDECSSGMIAASAESIDSDLGDRLLAELAKECGVEVSLEGLATIEEKLETFAEVSGKSRDAVVGFLNSLEEDALTAGIQMFGRKIGEQNKFTGERKRAIDAGEKEFEVDGKKYKVTGDTSDEKKQAKESMFDDIIAEMINEEVDVEQAEVVMAVRALADDIQDQIERLGRMMNEDVPAIADQMRAEMGASVAQGFADATAQVLNGYMEAAKSAKAGIDTQVSQMSGEEAVGGLGDTAELGAEPAMDPAMDAGADMGMADEEPVDNVDAAAGPAEEPLGRAAI